MSFCSPRLVIALLFASAFSSTSAVAQRTLTTDDYKNAERWMNYNVMAQVHHTISGLQYLPDGRVFYRDPGADGMMFMMADPKKGTVAPAFDNMRVTRR